MTYKGTIILFCVGLGVSLLGWICLFIAFASPYWFQSWPREFSEFRRIGLWDLCSNGLVSFTDEKQISYFGCWWIFAPYYKKIRRWIMPWWFILTQTIFSFTFFFETLKLIFEIVIFAKISGLNRQGGITVSGAGLVKGLTNFNLITDLVFGVLKSAVLILFGIAVYYDRNWMPNPELNYLSWSYGFAIISAFMSVFSIFPHLQFRRLVLQLVKTANTAEVSMPSSFPMKSFTPGAGMSAKA